jgi:hypothetical protein
MQPGQDIRTKDYLFVSDFDQTLSFNDSGIVLSELIGVRGFADRIRQEPAAPRPSQQVSDRST